MLSDDHGFISNKKKITYILLVSKNILKSTVVRNNVKQTINSVIKQTVPFCDLLIVADRQLISDLSCLIDECLIQAHQILNQSSASRNLNNESFITDDSYFLSDVKPEIRLYESPEDSFFVAVNTIKDEVQTEWLAFLDYRTELAQHTTYELITAMVENPEAEMLYGDHDMINIRGFRSNPVFKPIFSLDLLYSQNYIGIFFSIKSKYIKNYRIVEHSNDFINFTYAIILNIVKNLIIDLYNKKIKTESLCSLSKKIIHIPSVLHSVRKVRATVNKKLEQGTEQLGLLKAHFQYCYPDSFVSQIKPFVYRHEWPISKPEPLVSIIIPTKDSHQILATCIESVLKKTIYKNYEIIIVDNQSVNFKTINYLKKLTKNYNNIKILKYSSTFNYSDINNIAVKNSKGSVICFLNNDTEVISPSWLTEMVRHAVRPDIGCVGAMHYYPDNRIQHAGVIVGMHGVADHAFKGQKKSSRGDVNNYLCSIRNPDAVTAATLVVRKELFDLVGGFDSEYLKVAFNDVDLCLKISNEGYRCLWTPNAELFHYESKTRNLELADDVSNEIEVFEHKVMQDRWLTNSFPVRDLLRSINLSQI